MRGLLALGLVALLGACAPLGAPAGRGPPQTHVLSAVPSCPRPQSPTGKTLLISPPRVGAGLDSRRMAYVSRPFEVSYFASHEWADTPSRMLAPLMVRALEACGAFVAVVDSTSPARAEVRLDVDVLSLQHEFLSSPSQGRVEVRAQLVDLGSRSVLATETLGATEPALSPDPYGGVVALNRALERVLADLAAFAGRAAGRREP